ncbi:MAG TPA: hypothetical protein ENG12_00335 [Candidatus Altiarchaeales archaeon]|nr:hypothetical protein [Candidatus Altiarchaeales archaeon]
MDMLKGLTALPLTIVTSILLIFLGIIYFVITLVIVKVSIDLVAPGAEANWILLSAALITAASMLGAAIQRGE